MILERELIDLVYRNYFPAFVHQAFKVVYSGRCLEPSWHVDVVCGHLQAIAEGRRPRKLVLNMPPRSLKTFLVSVCYPAWLLLRTPTLEIVVASYADEFSRKPARQFRTLMESPLMNRLSRGALAIPLKSTENEYETPQSGGRFATSVGGTLTGRGADFLIIDDPMKADDAHSEAARRSVDDWFNTAAHSRRNRPGSSVMIVCMQRLHMADLAGSLLEKGWPGLAFPAIADARTEYDNGTGTIHVREAGMLLQPQRDSLEELEATRRQIGTYNYTAQYQQNPAPAEGNIVRREWLRQYNELPALDSFKHVYVACDPAGKDGEKNDYTALVVAGVEDRDLYVLEVTRGHWDCLEIKRRIEALATNWRATQIIIETTGLGEAVRQEIARENHHDSLGVQPKLDKITRLQRTIARFEGGHIHLPADASWLPEFEAELLGFPGVRYDDQVDATILILEDLAEREQYETPIHGIVLPDMSCPNPFSRRRFEYAG
jgi:predicted phage terminase large subunit-like protein